MGNSQIKQKVLLLNAKLFLLLAVIALPNNVHSKEIHPLDDIKNTARNYVLQELQNPNEDIQVIVGKLDSRLRLNKCSVPLEANSQNYAIRQGLSTVGVRCNDNKPWSLYVPVSIKNFKMVATLKHAVIRNSILKEDDIVFTKMNINRLSSGYFENISQLKGKVLSQSLTKGMVITKHHVKSPMAISRGQSVTIIAKNSAIEVRMKGMAMSKGAIGERIKVKNMKTERVVEGIIIDNHLINVNL